MKVLFTHSYFLRFDSKQFKTAMPYPPLGTLYAMAFLREKGYEVKLHDTMFSFSADEILPVLQEFKPDIVVSYDDGFNYLTKMCLTNMREACFKMQALAKQNGCFVITSSSDAADHFEKYIANDADAIAIGEAEQTVFELCEAFKNASSIENINGIAYKKNGSAVKTSKREVLKDLDHLPPPAWDLLNIEPYKAMWMNAHGYFSLNFVTTRGCPYKCNWCAKPIYGNRYNSHSPHAIVKQIKEWKNKFGFTHVWFADDIFGLKPNWLKQFSEAVKLEGLKIRYKIQSRADLLVEENSVKCLAESGCDTVWMGAESGSQKILDAMDKGIKVEEIKKAFYLLKQYQIKPALFIQFGYLGEQLEDIKQTVEMVNELLPNELGVSVSYPLPGTIFYEKVKEQLVSKANWTESDDLHLMFKNTYPPQFYRYLHKFLHHTYRINLNKSNEHELHKSYLRKKGSVMYHKLMRKKVLNSLKKIEPRAASIF
ncbi:MAG: radical SAM protein [Bacteroidota bacterium]|nr:radical SAM protein [Bacteroidota bacterium]